MAVFEQLQGWGYKNGCILGTVGLINTKFGHSIAEGVPYYQVESNLLWWCHRVCTGAQNASQMFFWLKNTKNKERYNLEWSQCVPKWCLKCFLAVWLEQWVSITLSTSSVSWEAKALCTSHHYYHVVKWWGFSHVYNLETFIKYCNIYTLSLAVRDPDDMCWWEVGKSIYICSAKQDQLTEGSVCEWNKW